MSKEKTIKNLKLVAAAFIVMNFVSCKKYEEGPAFSLRSKNNRLSDKTWEVKDVEWDEDVKENFIEIYEEMNVRMSLVLTC